MSTESRRTTTPPNAAKESGAGASATKTSATRAAATSELSWLRPGGVGDGRAAAAAADRKPLGRAGRGSGLLRAP
jgi:hypothetical protein